MNSHRLPFLQEHKLLRGPAFDEFVRLVCRDEAQHLALNWLLSREIARRWSGLKGFYFFSNPGVFLGALAVPWMSLDVYSLAHKLGYRFETLLPPFARLWRLHKRYPELNSFLPWQVYRLFVICGWVATKVCIVLVKCRLMFVGFWLLFTRMTDYFAWWFFGRSLLERRSLVADLMPEKG